MRALTVQQPWAWAIVHGGKDVENRTQAWGYRGPLAIHAGARVSDRGLDSPLIAPQGGAILDRRRQDIEGEARALWVLDAAGRSVKFGLRMPLRAIIGMVDLVDVHVAADGCCESRWGEREYGDGRPGFERVRRRDIVHLGLEHPRPLEVPIPCRGALGLWTPPAEVLAELEAAIA